MANRKILFSVLILCLSVYLSECGRFGGGRSSSRSSSRGGSSWGKGWGSSSGSSWSKPSSSSSWGSSGSSYKPSSSWNSGSSSSWGSSGSSYKPSSSWNTGSSSGNSWGSSGSSYNKPSTSWNTGSGTSIFSKPSSSGSGSHGYPSSSTGLSGTGSGSHGYPSSSTGLSGTGSGSHGYPSGTGLSGSSKYPSSGSSGPHGYPTSNTGLSGSGSSKYPTPSSGSHGYPTSNTGLSGSGSGKYPSTSNTHSYPTGTGLSGAGSGTNHKPTNYYPTNSYNTNSGYGGYGGSHSYHHQIPHTYYTAPQHVYITQYRDSGSRYGDLLTGLTLYNMGRSHSHYHDHYYYDDYYRHRYYGNNYNSQPQSSYSKPNDEATCTLRIKENGKLEVLKIPCEIVSTFTEGGKKIQSQTKESVNQTICTTNSLTSYKTPRDNVTTASPISAERTSVATTANVSASATTNVTVNNTANATENVTKPIVLGSNMNSTQVTGLNVTMPATPAQNVTSTNVTILSTPAPNVTVVTKQTNSKIIHITKSNKTEGNTFTETIKTESDTETTINVTTCTTTQNYIDPLTVKGSPIVDPSNMECSVDIKTKDAHFRNTVECKTLMEYSKMRAPPKMEAKPLLPPREKLKTWLNNPPWWMSTFIAV